MRSFIGSYGPERGIREKAADQLCMQGMASFVGFDSGEERQASQGQVADQVEGLVAAKFVREAQRPVHHAVVGQDNGIFQRTAANQAHGAERLDVTLEAKGPRTGQEMAKSVGVDS